MGDWKRWVVWLCWALFGLAAVHGVLWFLIIAIAVEAGPLCHAGAGYCTWQAWLISAGSLIAAIFAPLSVFYLAQTLRQMRRSSEQQLRAYMHVTGVTMVPDDPNCVTVVVSNEGQTPAYEVRIAAKVLVTGGGPLNDNIVTLDGWRPVGTYGPGQAQKIRVCLEPTNPGDGILDHLAWGHAVTLLGNIDYRDAFGVTRRTPLRYVSGVNPVEEWLVSEHGNDAD